MPRPHAPLIARLRRRLAALTWLLALTIVAKAAMASSCLGDGLAAPADPASLSRATIVADASIEPIEADRDACWHEGNGGCHCSCVHAAGLPVLASGLAELASASARMSTASSMPPPGLPSLAIRPPIA